MVDLGIKKRQGKPRNRIGLDIGSHSIKIVEIQESSGKETLTGCGLKKIHGLPKEKIADAIKALVEESKITAKDVNISISGQSLIARFVSMPKMSPEELKGAIRFEAEKFIPFDINEYILDFQVLNKAEKDKATIDALLVAVKKEHVWQKIKLVEAAGLGVKLVDVDSLAATNSFLKNFQALDPVKTVAILNMGASFTSLGILKGSAIAFARDVAIGGNDFNAAIAKKCNVALEASEELKLMPKEKVADIATCAKGVLANLLDEIKLSFSYHENQSGRSIDEIYISGGAAGTVGLEEAFQETLGSKPHYWNPFEFAETGSSGVDMSALEKSKSSFAVAVGLALR